MKAWEGILRSPVEGRSLKPRKNGWTMVIDKGLGLKETQDLIQIAADYIDDIKFTHSTTAFFDFETLKEKVRIIRKANIDVQPGGTLVELAVWQGVLDRFLERAKEFGFTLLEVADGFIKMSDDQRRKIISKAKKAGFKVNSEVGAKNPDRLKPIDTLRRQISSDIESGVEKILIEAMIEGVRTTIFDDSGNVKEETVEQIIDGFPPDMIVWEAPNRGQQDWLINKFGLNVNLANISPSDLLTLEVKRTCMGGMTLEREYLKTSGDITV